MTPLRSRCWLFLGMMLGVLVSARAGAGGDHDRGAVRAGPIRGRTRRLGRLRQVAQVRDLPGQEEGASLAAQGDQRPGHRHLRPGLQGQARLHQRDRSHQEGRGDQAEVRDLRGRQEGVSLAAQGDQWPGHRHLRPGLQGQARLRARHRRDQEGGREGQGRGGGGMIGFRLEAVLRRDADRPGLESRLAGGPAGADSVTRGDPESPRSGPGSLPVASHLAREL